MSLDRRLPDEGDLRVRDCHAFFERLGPSAEAGTEHDADQGLDGALGSYDGSCSIELRTEAHAAQPSTRMRGG